MTDQHQPPPLDLDALEQTWQRAVDGEIGWSYVLQEVPAVLAELRAQRAVVAILLDVGNEQEELINAQRATVAALTAENERLRTLLAEVLRFGFHRFECAKVNIDGFSWEREHAYESAPCTCGFDDTKHAALAEGTGG
jgi:hypothetical protein